MLENWDWPAERIKRLRRALMETQREFAKRLGKTYNAVHLWEAGKTTPRVAAIRLMLDLETSLELSPGEAAPEAAEAEAEAEAEAQEEDVENEA